MSHIILFVYLFIYCPLLPLDSELPEGNVLVFCLFTPMSPEQVSCWHSAWHVLFVQRGLCWIHTVYVYILLFNELTHSVPTH